ncbi:MAG TPA: AAA family ATPase [Dokdonella sp.]|uniref:AAA family ATPase n=1 Tax=Dokdonella sp. TaxID=2291710 RepID=UPI002CC07632|nr:AAA family ATPase [Dokdonella sp.]HUD41960.1 AAA family ATPase [Dokdonella sp.]
MKLIDSPPLPTSPEALRDALARATAQVDTVLLGKMREVRLAFVCLLAGGHLLIEDLPGVGKTTLAHALAATLGLSFQRVQFTSDLLPSDIIGVSLYEREPGRIDGGTFRFHPGPLFTQLLLADEINRATPKTQSALLEAMAEEQVTVDGRSHPLAAPFFVVATQNPLDLAGTYPLPDSQLDRFMLRMSLGYPDRAAEQAMLAAPDRRSVLDALQPCLAAEQVIALRAACAALTVSRALIEYVQALLEASRQDPQIRIGLSPRAGLALLAAARAHAYLAGRPQVLPEDVQAVFTVVAAHRLAPASNAHGDRDALARRLLDATPVR